MESEHLLTVVSDPLESSENMYKIATYNRCDYLATRIIIFPLIFDYMSYVHMCAYSYSRIINSDKITGMTVY